MAFTGRAHLMDYIENFLNQGTPKTLRFATLPQDRENTMFKFICREDATTKSSKILTGKIVYVDSYDEYIVLEKFKLKSSCTIDNINVNRQLLDHSDRFKIVFKTAEGKCYEREYESFKVDYLHEFVETTLVRKKAIKVECPVRFTGDIGLNQYISWWKFFAKRKPYILYLRSPEVKEGSR